MVNKNILEIRKKLDKLDNRLLAIIKLRTNLVNLVIKNKKYKKDIVDKKRISLILKNISRKSRAKRIDSKVTHKIWKSMIGAFIDYEYRNFKKK
jgi:chorismate mutase